MSSLNTSNILLYLTFLMQEKLSFFLILSFPRTKWYRGFGLI